MKLVKKLIALAVFAVVLLVVGVAVAIYFINDIVKAGVEKGGTFALGAKTTLASADIGVLSGSLALNGLEIENPGGFKGDRFFTMGNASAQVSIPTLRKDVVEIPAFSLTTLRVSLEKSGDKKNYQVILDNIQKVSGSSGESPKEPAEGSGKKFVLKDLDIRDVQVTLDLVPEAGEVLKFTVPIDRIHMTDIGSDRPLPLGELAGVIVRAILATAVERGQGIFPGDVLGDLQGKLAALGNLDQLGIKVVSEIAPEALNKATQAAQQELGKAAGQVQQQAEKAVQDATKGVDDALKGVKDLIPGRR
ncbi:MAG: hypothetical protein HRU70_14340 [Phycisphaeraceae bacterium]|nr:MAG: hypothetical protein HRU70_14340 [Phycisphaeraceae bacterium]